MRRRFGWPSKRTPNTSNTSAVLRYVQSRLTRPLPPPSCDRWPEAAADAGGGLRVWIMGRGGGGGRGMDARAPAAVVAHRAAHRLGGAGGSCRGRRFAVRVVAAPSAGRRGDAATVDHTAVADLAAHAAVL